MCHNGQNYFVQTYLNEYKGVLVLIQRGDIYYADLSPVIGSEQGGVRPVLVIQNDVGNKYSPTIIVAAVITVCILTFFITELVAGFEA